MPINLEWWRTLAVAAQASLTSVGIIIAGGWTWLLFVKRRQRYPRCEVSHEVSVFEISPSRRLLRVTVTLKNIGDVLIQIASGIVHVGRVLPLSPEVEVRLQGGEDLIAPDGHEMKWPMLGCREYLKPCEVEPGEIDHLHFDFLLPMGIEVVEVYSYFQNEKKRARSIGWRHTSLVRLEKYNLPAIEAKGETKDDHEKSTPSFGDQAGRA